MGKVPLEVATTATERGDSQTAVGILVWHAEQGNVSAQVQIAIIADDSEDYETSAYWYGKAAEQGDARAQLLLALMYREGNGVQRNLQTAANWVRKSAEQGFASAQSYLGELYVSGEGVPQNYAQSAYWRHKAASQGEAVAQHVLGLHYSGGIGVPENSVLAHMWFNLAAAQGHENAAHDRDALASEMTDRQLAKAQALAQDWQPQSSTNVSSDTSESERGLELRGAGSGFVVAQEGYVLTNNHVIEECREVRMTPSTRASRVLASDAQNDLALIQGSQSVNGVARFDAAQGARSGDNVVVAGFPLRGFLSSELNVTTGSISAMSGPGNDTRLMQITAPVQPGNSGGPLLNQGGQVIGVIVAKLDAVKFANAIGDIPQNVNFGIKAAIARNFLESNGVDFETASTENISNADVAEKAKAFTVAVECWK